MPPLHVRVLAEQALLVALAVDDPLAALDVLDPAELVHRPWIATPSRSDEPQLGVWPSLSGRPRVRHTAADWATKLHLVAAGCGITTVPASLAAALPTGVCARPVAGPPDPPCPRGDVAGARGHAPGGGVGRRRPAVGGGTRLSSAPPRAVRGARMAW